VENRKQAEIKMQKFKGKTNYKLGKHERKKLGSNSVSCLNKSWNKKKVEQPLNISVTYGKKKLLHSFMKVGIAAYETDM